MTKTTEGAGSTTGDEEWLGGGADKGTGGAEYDDMPPPPPGSPSHGERDRGGRLGNGSRNFKSEVWNGEQPTYGGVGHTNLQVYSSSHGWLHAQIVKELPNDRILVKYDKDGKSFQKRVHRNDPSMVRSDRSLSNEEQPRRHAYE